MTIENFEKAMELKKRLESLDRNIKKLTDMLNDGGLHYVVIYTSDSSSFEIDGELANHLLKDQISNFKETRMMTEKEFEKL
jgi:hypothetical protein